MTMPEHQNSNTKFPRSGGSSSVSLNDSPITDEINYDSDISEDEHAIAEGDDDEEEEDGEEDEPDEGFELEVSTLTGNTFSVMIQPEDTVEVLKTRIAFQEGISPADQNLVLEQGKLLDHSTSNNTIQELNIGRNSRLTLVTNVSSGVPFKNSQDSLAPTNNNVNNGGANPKHLWTASNSNNNGNCYKLAPTIRRNYNNHNGNSGNSLNLPQSQFHHDTSSSSLRLPKLLTTNNNNNNIKSNNLHENDDRLENDDGSSMSGPRILKSKNSSSFPERRNEREWMQSLFNKVVQQEQEEEEEEKNGYRARNNDIKFYSGGGAGADEDREGEEGDDLGSVIDIDSTTGRLDSTILSSHATRYGRKNFLPREDDGNILVVQGDDGVILIIQKNTGQLLLEDSSGNENDEETYNIDLGVKSGRKAAMGRYSQDQDKYSSSVIGANNNRKAQIRNSSDLVHSRIKENAVTLEKMRQVRSMMAQKDKQRNGTTATMTEKNLEFPKISNNNCGSGAIRNGYSLTVPGTVKNGCRSASTRKNNNGGTLNTTRSINSSKSSLNRLIAEIYLQSKRKGCSFQPGQPPYTEQQLLRYVQLKVAILLEEQRQSKTEPCSKCILDSDWEFNETAPFLIPTVVLNRYKRLSNSKSLDKELERDGGGNDEEPKMIMKLRRKSFNPNLNIAEPTHPDNMNESGSGRGRRNSQIPRLISVSKTTGDRVTPATTATTASTSSRRSSSSVPPGGIETGGGGMPPIRRNGTGTAGGSKRGSGSSSKGRSRNVNQYIFFNDGMSGDNNQIACDKNGQTIYLGRRPSLKIHQKVYTTSTYAGVGRAVGVGYSSKKSSRPGSSKNVKAKKSSVVRCPVCNKKIGIACRYQCRCGLVLCSAHRYPEAHECTFDYKTEGRNKIRENNPVVVAPKIPQI